MVKIYRTPPIKDPGYANECTGASRALCMMRQCYLLRKEGRVERKSCVIEASGCATVWANRTQNACLLYACVNQRRVLQRFNVISGALTNVALQFVAIWRNDTRNKTQSVAMQESIFSWSWPQRERERESYTATIGRPCRVGVKWVKMDAVHNTTKVTDCTGDRLNASIATVCNALRAACTACRCICLHVGAPRCNDFWASQFSKMPLLRRQQWLQALYYGSLCFDLD